MFLVPPGIYFACYSTKIPLVSKLEQNKCVDGKYHLLV